jgi:hypothetical protein
MSIRQYTRLRLPDEGLVLLQSEDNDPLLINIPYGKGSLVLSTFPWDRTASDFPLRPSFLPVVREVFALGNLDVDALPGMREEARIPSAESMTTISDPDEIRIRLRGGRESAAGSTSALAGLSTNKQGGIALGPWLLLAALLALATESLLARRLIAPT